MRHLKNTRKLGRTSQHRDAMLANLVLSLIQHGRIKTTVPKAKAARVLADKIVTLGKKGDLHHRRRAIAVLKYSRPLAVKGKRPRPDLIKKLFEEIAPKFKERQGGYTRVVKLGPRLSDAAPVAFLEWVENFAADAETSSPSEKASTKAKAKKSAPAVETVTDAEVIKEEKKKAE
jgi:large subunit ribosomal protein L17